MRLPFVLTFICLFSFSMAAASGDDPMPAPAGSTELSDQTKECLGCHESLHPGIVADWRHSLHATTSPSAGLAKDRLHRRISSETIPQALKNVAVGCFECHSLNASKHKDNFEHFGYQINIVVSGNDCATCHSVEYAEYLKGKKAHAVDNLNKNPLYLMLVETIDGVKQYRDGGFEHLKPSATTRNKTCFACHGSRIEVVGMRTLETDLGDVTVPELSSWPNQGVGRINPDGTLGSCTACHPRHSFSIEIARSPYTCSQCHLQPDVPAWDVYKESKHGNIVLAGKEKFTMDAVPWRVGEDFRAPTCATCHNALLVTPDDDVIAERTHDFSARIWRRIFGLVYSHPQPKEGATYTIKNDDGLPLPTTFEGKPAAAFLIGAPEQERREAGMKKICQSCHGVIWTDGYFAQFDTTWREVDQMTLAATAVMAQAWENGLADPANPFDEYLEQLWVKQWLFYGNSVRYSAAMSGQDFATFKNGWWELTHNLEEMKAHVSLKTR